MRPLLYFLKAETWLRTRAALDPFIHLASPCLFLASILFLFILFLWEAGRPGRYCGLAVTQPGDQVQCPLYTVCRKDLSLSLHWLLEQKSHDLLMLGELDEMAYGNVTYKCNSEIMIAQYQLSFLYPSL